MPRSGSQIILCDIPVRFDTYSGCGHACSYCFVTRKSNIAEIKNDEGAETLRNWINGKRSSETSWCDWDIPLHWGGMSDPFQPKERTARRSLGALKVFAETGYPFVVSTKSAMIAEEPYFSLLAKSNCVVQFSIVSPLYDKIERGASPFAARLSAAAKLSQVCRVNFRIQPYVPGVFRDIIREIPQFKKAGVHGIILEGMKYTKPRISGLVPVGNDYCYPTEVLLPQFEAIKKTAHRYGLKFYCGENRLRALSDELCCCGIEGLGWRENKANLNHYLFDRDNYRFTPKMQEVGTATAFKALEQDAISCKEIPLLSYADKMRERESRPYAYYETGIRFTDEQAEGLRLHLVNALEAAGKRRKDVDVLLGTAGMAGHYFGKSQWQFPSREAFEKMRTIIPSLDTYDATLSKFGVKGMRYKIFGLGASNNKTGQLTTPGEIVPET